MAYEGNGELVRLGFPTATLLIRCLEDKKRQRRQKGISFRNDDLQDGLDRSVCVCVWIDEGKGLKQKKTRRRRRRVSVPRGSLDGFERLQTEIRRRKRGKERE